MGDLLLLWIDKVCGVILAILFWLHQGGIPYRTCRFYLLLAGAVEERQGIAIPYPSPTPLLTPLGDPLRRGISAAAGLGQYRIPVSGAIAYHHFDVRIGCFVFGFVSFAFQMVLFGLYRTFFIIGWKKDAVCVSFFARFWDYR